MENIDKVFIREHFARIFRSLCMCLHRIYVFGLKRSMWCVCGVAVVILVVQSHLKNSPLPLPLPLPRQYVGDILNDPDKRKCALSAMILNNLCVQNMTKTVTFKHIQHTLRIHLRDSIQFNQHLACVAPVNPQ